MSNSRRSAVVFIPDAGQGYAPGAPIRIVRTVGHVELILDPRGDYEVYSCETASGMTKDPLLRVVLRKV
jgi:hypothetical protein